MYNYVVGGWGQYRITSVHVNNAISMINGDRYIYLPLIYTSTGVKITCMADLEN